MPPLTAPVASAPSARPRLPQAPQAAWSSLHDLALVHLALAHGTGAERIRAGSQVAIHDLVHAWAPETDEDALAHVMDEALLAYVSLTGDHMLDIAIATLHQLLARDQRLAVLSDLADLVVTSGLLFPGGASYIQRLAQDWDLERDV